MGRSDRAPAQVGDPTRRQPLRLWPGVIAAVLLLLVRFGVPMVAPGFEGFRVATIGGFLGVLAIVVWWILFSRSTLTERWGVIILMVIALVTAWHVNHESMGLMWCVSYAGPILSLALVVWAVASSRLADGPRYATLVATILLACGVWPLVRMDGLTGDHAFEFAWRWTETREERLLAQAGDGTTAISSVLQAAQTGAGWPGFRGAGRDSIIPGVQIETDWAQSPPVELWRRPIGPGWSSFAVHGDLLYTQEQRGEEEIVGCYRATTGEPQWKHRNTTRFFESMGGPGPRATPTLSQGRLYTLGATGILNALEADDGTVEERWTSNRLKPNFNDFVVHAGHAFGFDGRMLSCIDVADGERRWKGGRYGHGQLVLLADQDLLLVLSEKGELALVMATAEQFTELARYPVIEGKTWNHPVLAGNLLLVRNGQEMAAFRLSLTSG